MGFTTNLLYISPRVLLDIARGFNKSINLKKNKKKSLDEIAAPWVDKIIGALPTEVTCWRSAEGKPIDDPLEIRILAFALLLDTWLADICLRKARDRSNLGMLALLEDYWDLLQSNHHFILRYTLVEQDPAAVKAYAAQKQTNQRLRSKA